ncbi:MAG: PAS domain-containing hybrid sensor histidine kinase/response regulator [Thermodesulfobacteriota bacterium]
MSRADKTPPPKTNSSRKLDKERVFDALFSSAPVGILIYSEHGQVLEANEFLLQILGSPSLGATRSINLFTFENLIRRGISDVLRLAIEKGQPQQCSTVYDSKWGKSSTLDVKAYPLRPRKGLLREGIAIVQDVTALASVQEDLAATRESFRLLAEKIPLAIAILDKEYGFEYANPRFRTLFEYTPEDTPTPENMLARIIPDPLNPRKGFDLLIASMPDSTEKLQTSFRLRKKDGTSRSALIQALDLSDRKRVLICQALSDLIFGRDRLHTLDNKYSDLIDSLTDVVFVLDPQGILLGINKAGVKLFGYAPDEIIGKSIAEIMPEPVRSYLPETLKTMREQGVTEGISQFISISGVIHYLEYRSDLVKDDSGSAYIVGVARDITEKIRSKRALRESEAKFQIFVETVQDGITYVDLDGTILFANPRMKDILGDPSPEGKMLGNYYDEENRRILEENLAIRRQGRSSTYYVTLTNLQGQPHQMVVTGTPYIDSSGEVQGALGVYTDVSELRKLEAQLQQSQKLEALGTLAGGIAHDFNNILSGVLGYASLIKKRVAQDSQLSHYAEMVEKSAERGAALAGQLLAFSRKDKTLFQDTDVHELIDEIKEILERTLDRKITVMCDKRAARSVISGDAARIQQMLMNLCLNSRDAMPNGGLIMISTDLLRVDESLAETFDGIAPGSYVQITVQDEGEGMGEAVKARLFEPFFTTKEDGKGTGLGLAMVYATVKSHGGAVKVHSEPRHGTEFHILIPAKAETVAGAPTAQQLDVTLHKGTILLVDDEASLREMLSEMLQEMGMAVIAAADGSEGVEIYRRRWQEIDLVILDMIMPRMNGKEAFIEMRRINPSVKVLLSTGYGAETALTEALAEGIAGFVPKPYTVDELSQAIAAALAFKEPPIRS